MSRTFCADVVRLVALAFALSLCTTARAELLTNPGFETGDFTGWSTFGNGWRIGTNGDAHTGTYGVVDDVLTTDVDEWRGVYQEISASEGDEFNVSAYLRAVNVETTESWLEVQFLNASSGIIQQFQSAHVTTDQGYTLTELNNLVAPANTASIGVRGIVQNATQPTIDTDFHTFDDFSLTMVPEPSMLLLVSVGLLGLFGYGWRQRRRSIRP